MFNATYNNISIIFDGKIKYISQKTVKGKRQ